MRRDDLLDERMLDWLADGPWDVPPESLEAVMVHVRAHPRRRVTRVRRWKNVMTGGRPARVEPRGGTHGTAYHALAAAAVVVIAVGLVGGLAILGRRSSNGPAVGPGAPVATPSPAQATATPFASPSPSAVTMPVPVDLTAASTCHVARNGTEGTRGGVSRTRGLDLACTSTSTDPRLAGSSKATVNIDRRLDDQGAELWGTGVITTADGTWRSAWRGTGAPGDVTQHLTGVMIGEGAYAGLRIRYVESGTVDGYELTGTLERADTVPPDGTLVVVRHACQAGPQGSETQNGDVMEYRGVVLACDGPASDPRLDFPRTVTVDIIEYLDGHADHSGTVTIEGEQGTWTGDWTGTVDVGYTTHRGEGVLIGSGAYAGLAWRFTQIGTPDTGYVSTGTIGPAP